MAKIYVTNRDYLQCLDLDSIALIKAEGNYSRIFYLNKHETLLTYGIGMIYDLLSAKKSECHHFIRLGRSIVVNHAYLYKIDLQKQVVELADKGRNIVRISIPKTILRSYKEAVEKSIVIKNAAK